MPLVLYCVTPESAADTSLRGVDGTEVRSKSTSGLKFFYSEVVKETKSPDDLVDAAQQVHLVLNDIFARSAVLPFRYPTVLQNEAELERFAAERGASFGDFLRRVEGKVQMDIRFTIASAEASEGGGVGATSGRAYLEGRARSQALLSAAAETCRQTANSADWRIQQRGENFRCQALISRVEVLSFLERMRRLELPEGVKAAVSGPWPPAAFWEDRETC